LERSDELTMPLQSAKTVPARTSVEGAPPPKPPLQSSPIVSTPYAIRFAHRSWNCLGITELMLNGLRSNQSEGPRMKSAFVTYWLNKLQSLKTDQNFFVSLNPRVPPHPKTTHGIFNLSHPQFTRSTLAARATIQKTNGTDNLYFCGAWMGFGFHEDGLRSGLKVAKLISPDDAITPLAPPNHYAPTKPSIISFFTSTLPVKICKFLVNNFLVKSIVRGKVRSDEERKQLPNVILYDKPTPPCLSLCSSPAAFHRPPGWINAGVWRRLTDELILERLSSSR